MTWSPGWTATEVTDPGSGATLDPGCTSGTTSGNRSSSCRSSEPEELSTSTSDPRRETSDCRRTPPTVRSMAVGVADQTWTWGTDWPSTSTSTPDRLSAYP